MTLDVQTAGVVVAILGAVGAFAWWALKTIVLSRVEALELGLTRQAERFGENIKAIEKWQAAHDAVEGERELSGVVRR